MCRLTVRSLKNVLAVRGAGCNSCRTREDLFSAALHATTLAPKNVTLALFDSEVACAPRGIVILNVFEARYRLLVQRAVATHQRFALKQGPTLAIVVKILEHGEQDGVMWIKVRGGLRVQVRSTVMEPHTHGLLFVTGYLFVDHPVFKREAAVLHDMQKRVRRLFFVLDSDASANVRALSIGNPPEETHGPESLSHWVSHAVSTPHFHSQRVERQMARFLFHTQNTTRRLDVLDHFFSSILQGCLVCMNDFYMHA